MISNCMLQNAEKCINRKAISEYRSHNRILIVHGYDWKAKANNPSLIKDFVTRIAEEVCMSDPVEIRFQRLGGKEGRIYCDICEQIQKADIALFDVSTNNVNVILELGLAISSGAYVYILRSRHSKYPKNAVSDLDGVMEYRFTISAGHLVFETDLESRLKRKLRVISRKKAA